MPARLAGERACRPRAAAAPPEDCGGPPEDRPARGPAPLIQGARGASGCTGLLAAPFDPQHQEHDATLQWLGGDFEPEAFDLAAVNRRVGRVREERRATSG